MNLTVLRKLRDWRDAQAAKEGVALYYVLGTKTLDLIAEAMPQTREEFLAISGIGEKKMDKYGTELMRIVSGGETGDKAVDEIVEAGATGEKIFSVSTYLDLINIGLKQHFQARVKGEVSEFKERGGHYYFKIKDKDDESCLDCFIWGNAYKMNGVDLADGMEITIGGFPGIFKRRGSFNFNCETMELVGEGALKAAYEKLKAKLEAEGFFDPSKKRSLPEYPQKIGLITSNKGDAIHDFTSNLGKYGYAVKFLDSRVEGQQAVKDLLEAVEYFKDKDIDVLVLVRGGGAWEALQAYNNEMLVKAIRAFPKPVLVGVGHEKDITLVALAADKMVSTPTATAKTLNLSWDHAAAQVRLAEQQIVARFTDMLVIAERQINQTTQAIEMYFRRIFENFRRAQTSLESHAIHFGRGIQEMLDKLRENYQLLIREWRRMIGETTDRVSRFEETLILHDPERPLRLGYSIARSGGKIIKSIKDITLGEALDVRVSDGTIRADIVAFKNVNYEGK